MTTAGQMDQSRGGVLYLGNMNNIKQSVRSGLVRSVERGAGNTALWSWAGVSGVKHRSGGHSTPMSSLVTSLQDVSSVFHVVVSTLDTDHDTDLALSSHSLNTDQDHAQSPVTASQLRHYIAQVRDAPVSTPPLSRSLIQKYFLASRRVRANFPQSSLVTLLRLAENHAR